MTRAFPLLNRTVSSAKGRLNHALAYWALPHIQSLPRSLRVTTASRKVDLTSALCSEDPPRYFRQSQTVRFVPKAVVAR